MSQLEVHYDTSNIMLTLGIAFIGSYAAVSLCEQYRLAALSSAQSKRYFVLFLVATSLGWACTWCMHCCSLSSIKLKLDGTDIPIRYNRGLIILAAFQSVVQTYIGLIFSAADPCFNCTRKEIMEKFIARASNTYTLEQIKRMSKFRILFIVCTHSLERLNVGGGFGGAGIALAHYIIMFSIQFQGKVHYNVGIVVASVIFSAVNGTGGFWVFFRFLSLFPSLDFLRVIVAVIGVVTVCGMHYVGMTASTFHYNGNAAAPNESSTIGQGELYSMAVSSSVIFVIVMLIFTLSDLRSWLLRTSTQLRQADKALHALMKRTQNTAANNRNSSNARTPVEVLRYTRKFLAPDLTGTLSSDSTVVTTAEVHPHSMYTDYNEEDEDTTDAAAAAEHSIQRSIHTMTAMGGMSGSFRERARQREVSILRRDHLSNHNLADLADLENQQYLQPSVLKPLPTPQTYTGASSSVAITSEEDAAMVGCYAENIEHIPVET